MIEVYVAEVCLVLVVGFPTGAFQANCYVLAAGGGGGCVIVDAGEGAVDGIERTLREHRLTVDGVLATHGHVDHVHSAATVADAHGVPVWIRPEDRAMLSDPLTGLGADLAGPFGDLTLHEPRQVVELGGVAEADVPDLELGGLRIAVDHTPGHTRGSVVFRIGTDEGGRIALTGDTLFAGSIGRTDLPGGDVRALARSLRTVLLPLPDDTVVLPGHGDATTIGRERSTNPFLGSDR